jgi:hypothetical protein
LKAKSISLKRIASIKNCIVCGKEFKYRIGDNRECCSVECRSKLHTEKRNCLYCGKEFFVIKSSHQKFCCHKCYANSSRKEKQAPKRRGSNWNSIRREFKKTSVLCEFCREEKAVDLHHIIPYKYFKSNWEQANKKQNLIALCQKCHIRIEEHIRKMFNLIKILEGLNNGIGELDKK